LGKKIMPDLAQHYLRKQVKVAAVRGLDEWHPPNNFGGLLSATSERTAILTHAHVWSTVVIDEASQVLGIRGAKFRERDSEN
jgi:hypothetical protein